MDRRYIYQPHPAEVQRLVEALLRPDPPPQIDIICIPEPWRTALMRLGRSYCRPEPVLYGLAAYCAQRATHPNASPHERTEWIAVHELARAGMRLRRRGGPSKQLDPVQRTSWKLVYEELRKALEPLPRSRDPHDGLVKPAARTIRGRLQRLGLNASEDAVEQIRVDFAEGSRGRTWEGLQALLAAEAGLSRWEFRRQVVEWRRSPRSPSPEQRRRRGLFRKLVRAKTSREAARLRRLYELTLPSPRPPLGIIVQKTPCS